MLLAAGISLGLMLVSILLGYLAIRFDWGENVVVDSFTFAFLAFSAAIGLGIPGLIYANYEANIVGDLEAQNFKVEKASGFGDWAIIRIDGKRAKCSVDTESGYQYVIRKGTCEILPDPREDDADVNDVKKQLAGLEGK